MLILGLVLLALGCTLLGAGGMGWWRDRRSRPTMGRLPSGRVIDLPDAEARR